MVLNLIFVCNIYILLDFFFLTVFGKRDAVSFLHEKSSARLQICQNSMDLYGSELLTFEQACSVLGGGGKRVLYLQMLADCKN